MGERNHRVALVTGASRGIGLAVSQKFARDGFDVVAADISPSVEEVYARSIASTGTQGFARRVDVTVEDSIDSLVCDIVDRLGSLDVLVHCAGMMQRLSSVATMSDEQWNKVMTTNLNGMFMTCRAVARIMIEQQSGAIVTLGGALVGRGWVNRAAYAASKSAIDSLTKSLALELAPHGIRVNCVAPALISTDSLQDWLLQNAKNHGFSYDHWRSEVRARIPLNRFGQASEVAEVIAFAASEAASYMTGCILEVDGGYGLGGRD